MSNILQFPAKPAANTSGHEQKPTPAWRVRIGELGRQRAAHAENGQGRGPALGLMDRLICARALREQVDRPRQEHGITQEKVAELLRAHADGLSSRSGKRRGTDRLARFMVSRGFAPDAQLARQVASGMPGNLYGYWDIATFTARACSLPEEIAQYELIKDTGFWAKHRSTNSAVESDDPAAEAICKELRAVCAKAIKKTDFGALLGRIARTPASWNPDRSCFETSTHACVRGALLGGNEHWSEAPPYPSLVIGDRHVADIPILIDNQGLGQPDKPGLAHLHQEFRLVLGHASSPDRIEPMLERRCHTSISLELAEDGSHSMPFAVANQGAVSDAWYCLDIHPVAQMQLVTETGLQPISVAERPNCTSSSNGQESPLLDLLETWQMHPGQPDAGVMPVHYFTYFELTPASLRLCGGNEHWWDRFGQFVIDMGPGPLAPAGRYSTTGSNLWEWQF
jgi:hypothetical protein